MIITSNSPEQTRELGRILGLAIGPGDVVVLDGDLGAGKTTFTQGVGTALALAEEVTSPTFVVAREHAGGEFVLNHVDAYRLGSLAEWDDLDVDVEGSATVIEWGERIAAALPDDRLTICFHGDGDRRELTVTAGGPRAQRLLAALAAGS